MVHVVSIRSANPEYIRVLPFKFHDRQSHNPQIGSVSLCLSQPSKHAQLTQQIHELLLSVSNFKNEFALSGDSETRSFSHIVLDPTIRESQKETRLTVARSPAIEIHGDSTA
jgi:hypothetical protein